MAVKIDRWADVELPEEGTADAAELADVFNRVNGVVEPGRRILIGRRCMWATIGAVRAEFPAGGFDPNDPAAQDAVARRLGLELGNIRLAIARYVMLALAERQAAGTPVAAGE